MDEGVFDQYLDLLFVTYVGNPGLSGRTAMDRRMRGSLILCVALMFSAIRVNAAEDVKILRDDFGTPYIYAKTDEGACFGLGYAQAEDRLEELLRQYRRASGTMAEAFGKSEYQQDYRQRLWRHRAVSEANYSKQTPKSRAMIEAFVEGIKAYMKDHPKDVPAWAPQITPYDPVALGRYIIWGWPEGDAGDDLKKAGISPDPIEYHGSNEWLLSGSHTASGHVLALIDPHLSWYGPTRFYECRMYGETIKISGMGILGAPLPALGHSQWCSIAMTTGSGDTADVFVEKLNPANPLQYEVDGQWRDMVIRKDKINVKKDDGKMEAVEVEFHDTRHGPVVAVKDGKAYAMAIPYAESVGLSDETYDMLTAKNLSQMKKALGELELMGQNVMIGTVDGDIYYQRTGKVPIRPKGVDPSSPIPGETTKNDWLGIHKAADLVHLTNPPVGYMQNCNVSPFAMVPDGMPRVKDYPDYVYHDAEKPAHQRAAAVLYQLKNAKKVTDDQALEIAMSSYVPGADLWQSRLKQAWGAKGPSGASADAKKLYDLISKWDLHSRPESTGAMAYMYWKVAIPKELKKDDATGGGPASTLTDKQAIDALEEGAKKMLADHKTLEVPYGKVFRIGRKGGDKTYPAGGGERGGEIVTSGMVTLRAIGFFDKGPDGTLIGERGQTSTQIVELSKPPKSWTVLPLGESDKKDSGHWDDQAEKLFSKGKMKPTYFMDDEGLKKVTKSTETVRFGK